jgi:hypothetical protein
VLALIHWQALKLWWKGAGFRPARAAGRGGHAMTAAVAPARRRGPAGAGRCFAAMLAAAGLPIYIHAPKFYVDEYGVSLAALGVALFALRLIDVVQDPALGWLADAGRTAARPAGGGARC